MLKAGKLDNDLLQKIVFDNLNFRHPEVLTRGGIGEDCATIDFGTYECVISTDPITAAASHIGRLAVHISCNDIASNGIEPLALMLAVMLPVGTTEKQIEQIMFQAGQAAEELKVEIVGGHTEITPSVTQPVIVATAIGKAPKGASQQAKDMKPGDLILLTKSAGLEGAGILATDFESSLHQVLTLEELDAAKKMLDQVSVVAEGVAAGKIGTHGMHDVTEGGVLGALWEMCQVSKTGAQIQVDKVPIDPITRKICNHFKLDPLRLISSGCMLIIVDPSQKQEMEEALNQIAVPAAYIGQITDESQGIRMQINGESRPVAPPASDELYKVITQT